MMKNNVSVLLDYQQRWVSDNSEVKIAEKSRRIGLTWAEAADDVLLASAKNGMDVYYISYNFEFTKEFIQTCVFWAKGLGQAAAKLGEEIIHIKENGKEDEFYTASKITFPSGHKIMGLPARATTIRGRQGKIVIDEAAFCEDLAELIKAAMALLMWGGRVSIISTHNGESNPFNELIQEVKAGKKPYSLHKTTITDALSDGLYRRICEKKKEIWSKEAEDKWLNDLVAFYGDGAAEELYCIPSKSGARYFSSALVENCMSEEIPVLRYEQTSDFTLQPQDIRNKTTDKWIENNLKDLIIKANVDAQAVYIGEDFARSGDLTVIVLNQKISDTFRKGICNVEMRNIPFDQQLRVWRYIMNETEHIWGVSLDARGNGQMIAEMLQQDYGKETVNTVMITSAFYLEFMPALKSRFEAKEILCPKSIDIVDDFRLVAQIKGIPRIPDTRTGETGQKNKLRHGDTVVAELMVEHAIKNDSGYQEYSYESATNKNNYLISEGDDDEDQDRYTRRIH